MKRLFLFLAMMELTFTCFAVHYRGMFDLEAGPAFPMGKIHTSTGDLKQHDTTFAGMISTSHGCQLNHSFFLGAGFGICSDWGKFPSDSSEKGKNDLISFPIFVDLRWDLDVDKKLSPFAGARIGYQLGTEGYRSFKAESGNNPAIHTSGLMKSEDGVYAQLTAGARLKIGKNTGMNFGISYIPILRRSMYQKNLIFFNRSCVTLNVGIDIQGIGKSDLKDEHKKKLQRLQQRKLERMKKTN